MNKEAKFYKNLNDVIKNDMSAEIKVFSNKDKNNFKLSRKEIADFFGDNEAFLNGTADYFSEHKSYGIIKVLNRKKLLNYLQEMSEIGNNRDKYHLVKLEEAIKSKKNNFNIFSNEIRFPFKAINILLYNDTKKSIAYNEVHSRNYLLKSISPFYINNEEVVLSEKLYSTISYNFFSNEKIKLSFKGTIVLIENKESFDFADKIFDVKDHLFILYGGNASDKEHDFFANNVYAERLVYFGDYDYVSLNEYNKLRRKISNIELYYSSSPKIIEEKIIEYGNPNLYKNQEIDYNNIKNNFDEISKLLWRIIEKYKKG